MRPARLIYGSSSELPVQRDATGSVQHWATRDGVQRRHVGHVPGEHALTVR